MIADVQTSVTIIFALVFERIESGGVKAYMTTHTKTQFTKSDIGCILDCSGDSADTINERTISFAARLGFNYDPLPDENDEDYGQILSEVADQAVDFLNDQDGLQYCSFYFEDNSLFYAPCIEMVKEDVDFVSSRKNEYPPDDFEGEWLHVSDHGNATLYVRENGQDTEVWGIV